MTSETELIARAAEPLPAIDDPGFADLIDRYAAARVVLLGEASHGTSEFYRARAALTRRLVERHGFTVLAVEADWPDAAAIDRIVRDRPRAGAADPPFQRFPRWMWLNREVMDLVGWLREHNAALEPEQRTGFYGLDLYNLSGSMRAVVDYLDRVDPDAAAIARRRFGCLEPWADEPARYGAAALAGYARCEAAVIEQCRALLRNSADYAAGGEDAFLDAAQNARLVAAAEEYYRVMYHGGAESWNLRDSHMAETLCNLLDARGPGAKAVVWAHNSHLGDARATDMGRRRGEHNVGQLMRQRFGTEAALIGFGTHSGTVAAADDWDGPMKIKRVNPSLPGSVERLCHESGLTRFHLALRHADPDVRACLSKERLERFIGVIYRPDTERWSHYAESVLAEQFDSWIWFDETRAVEPLPGVAEGHEGGPAELFPFGQ